MIEIKKEGILITKSGMGSLWPAMGTFICE